MPEVDNGNIRVLVADDHAVFRRGLEMVLASEDDITVIAEADDGQQAVNLALELAPDLILMDVRMPVLSGIEATRTIKERLPDAKIVMLTISDEEDDLYEAIKAGADGYLLKEISIDEVAEAVRSVHAGQSMLSPRWRARTRKSRSAPRRGSPTARWRS
jgi:two-component system NarL family response regulator